MKDQIRDEVLLTAEGLAVLQKELSDLKNQRQPAVIERIKRAKEYGDLAENAEYDDAKNEQGFIAGRIVEIEEILKKAKVVKKQNDGIVELGSKVNVHIDGVEEVYTIVGGAETDSSTNRISHESPLGQALLGKKVGDKVEVKAPAGTIIYTIRKIV